MRHAKLLALTCLTFSLAGVTACGSDDDSQSDNFELGFVPGTSSTQALRVGEGDAAFDVTSLSFQLREIKVLPDSGGDTDTRFQAKGTFTLDVLDSANNTIAFNLPAGNYKKVEFKIDKPDSGGGLQGTSASLWFEGQKGTTKFRYLAEKTDKITLRDVAGIDLADGGSAALNVDLAVATWLDGVDLTMVTAGDDGVAVFEKSGANKKAYDAVEANIKKAIKLARKP